MILLSKIRGAIWLSLISYASTALASRSPHGSLRRSLSIFSSVPDASFSTSSRAVPSSTEISDPFDIALEFLYNRVGDSSAFKIRPDSYTDASSGVTHVYVTQLVNGLEVTNAHMNLNIRQGAVISFGDSFYTARDATPSTFDVQNVNCDGDRPWDSSGDKRHHEGLLQSSATQASLRTAILHLMSLVTRRNMFRSSMTISRAQSLDENPNRQMFTVENVPEAIEPVKGYLAYAQVSDASGSSNLELVWKLEVQMKENWYEATVTVASPHRVISLVDWVADYSSGELDERPDRIGRYRVFAWGLNDPNEGGRTLEHEHVDRLASPVGWHGFRKGGPKVDRASVPVPGPDMEFEYTSTTWGNNVLAQEGWKDRYKWPTNLRAHGNEDQLFDFEFSPKATSGSLPAAVKDAQAYANASITQLFYVANMAHDLFYRYGFTEEAGNFQEYNFGRGGKENDGIIAMAQSDASTLRSFNNAMFARTPDGIRPYCLMYLWIGGPMPLRDGVFDESVLVHELVHGLSGRLTGGPAATECLASMESAAMSEGWSDFVALLVRGRPGVSDYIVGAWVENMVQGSRHYPYSPNKTTNPLMYADLNTPANHERHNGGEIWAEMLWVVAHALIEKHGFTRDLFPPLPSEDGTIPEGNFYRPAEYTIRGAQKPLVPKHGNSLILQLVVNAMKLQPCNPTFVDARDAILQADEVLTGGENSCAIWDAFASRGLGVDAAYAEKGLEREWKNGMDIPRECRD